MTYNEQELHYSPEPKGPLKNRSCTDWPCLIIFVAFIVAWIGIGCYALHYGNVQALLAPRDTHGRKCGIDNDVINEPYLVFFDLRECLNTDRTCKTPQVCRKECPSTYWYAGFFYIYPLSSIRKNIICNNDVDVNSVKSKDEFRELINAKRCAEWYLKSESVVGRCIPTRIPIELIGILPISPSDLKLAQRVVRALAWAEEVVDTMISTRGFVFGFVGGGAVLCLAWIFLLRWLAFPFVFVSVIALCAFFSFLAYYFHGFYVADGEQTWLVLTIVFAIIAGLILLVFLCLLKRIQLACRLIKEASKAVMSILSTLFFPIFPWLLHLSTIVYVTVVGIHLASVETQDVWRIRTFVAIHIVGFIWLYCFITALGEMILASTFATWYWTYIKADVPFFTIITSAYRTVRYHLGTIAFGSLLITICRVIRLLLEAIRRATKKEGAIFLTACICCAQVVTKIVEKMLQFMNRNAYILCAVYGKGLCSSASEAISLILRNALRVVVLNNMVSWLLWLGKISITVAAGMATWGLYTSEEHELKLWWVPVVLVVIGVYLVANVFFAVYEIAVDTIFLCFLEDCERHDGSLQKPYYMSRSLRKLLHKRF